MVGLIPAKLLLLDGHIILPSVSEPKVTAASPMEAATPEPDENPHGVGILRARVRAFSTPSRPPGKRPINRTLWSINKESTFARLLIPVNSNSHIGPSLKMFKSEILIQAWDSWLRLGICNYRIVYCVYTLCVQAWAWSAAMMQWGSNEVFELWKEENGIRNMSGRRKTQNYR
jgi:hypothetical protein